MMLFIIMAATFILYVTGVTIKYGWLPSVSESYYRLPDNKKWMFSAFCWLFAFPAMILGDHELMFFAGTGICFVGAAPFFKEDTPRIVHYVGAITAIVCGEAYIALVAQNYWLFGGALGSMALAAIINKNSFFWIEIAAFFSVLSILYEKI